MLRYKIIETSTVTDAELEKIVNEWVGQGWELDGFQFVTHESSRRPKMAFVLFTAPADDDDDEDFDEDEDDDEIEGESGPN